MRPRGFCPPRNLGGSLAWPLKGHISVPLIASPQHNDHNPPHRHHVSRCELWPAGEKDGQGQGERGGKRVSWGVEREFTREVSGESQKARGRVREAGGDGGKDGAARSSAQAAGMRGWESVGSVPHFPQDYYRLSHRMQGTSEEDRWGRKKSVMLL